MRRWLVGLLLLVVMATGAAGWFVYADYQRFLDTPLRPPSPEGLYRVERGTSLERIARDLAERGVLERPFYLQIYGRLSGQAGRLQAGEYRIGPQTTPRRLLADMAAGRVVQYGLTVVEGWIFAELLEALRDHPRLEQTLVGLDGAAIMARLGHPEQHPEGRFLPETYHFPAGTSDLAFLRRAHAAMARELDRVWAERQPGLPLESPDQALVLASIIEKETGVAGERRQIAGVFMRRLRRGMRLQTDPTVIYGLGASFDGNLRRADLEHDTPYNTYTRGGLPPTPIALPSRASLHAAVDPAAGDALYFVADGEGGHVFSRTLSEHNRAVRAYLRRTQ
ncbi:MAG: endolytic transglycosylase MltG [Candidatus Competibacterales bacterium]|nr:endolytic transglycosylase MltG [Candidatus Competibacterales bacterium]